MSGETPDQAATRRRWITLAELVAVAGVVIAGLTLWTNWSDRRDAAAERSAAAIASAKAAARYTPEGKVIDNDRSVALLRDEDHVLTDLRVSFPAALGVAPRDAIDQRVEADWFSAALLKRTDGGPDAQTGRLPVLLSYAFLAGDTERHAVATYDLVWETEGRFLKGRGLKLVDFRLRRRGGDQRALDRAWRVPANAGETNGR
jgi:hypothetical protein